MKIDELSFAAQVLEIANRICETELNALKNSIEDDAVGYARVAAWVEENPVPSFVPRAYALISNTARQIEQLRG